MDASISNVRKESGFAPAITSAKVFLKNHLMAGLKFAMAAVVLTCCQTAVAQRFTDNLDRGLVAVPTGSSGNSTSNLVTWRRLADEYYGVTYNVYKNGTKVASNLTVTTYNDSKSAPATTSYQVAAVVNGVEQAKCAAVTPWAQYVYKIDTRRCPTGYLDIDLASVYDRDGNDVTDHYSPNDAEMADLDGDGQLEIIIKRLNTVDAAGYDSGLDDAKGNDRYIIYPVESKEFVVIDAYDVNWQTGAASLLWRIDCGPNMVSANSTEIDIIAYDWDEDGKAEAVLRGADNMIVYGSDGKTQLYTIGDMSVNTRKTWYTSNEKGSSTGSLAYTSTGAEYLLYLNGLTGALYQKIDYPLTRGNASDWGDTSGHRSSKYFFGAPFLDGRNASLFLGRGIYTRHKMMAMDLNRSTHEWSTRWSWNCSDSSSPWYGNGYHNFIIADVDEDGRDEIVYGSMVIDDNGKGLSTTGLGHGDAQHVSDFDPYRKGLEFFGCNEDKPAMNYRNATTSEIYIRRTATDDDGRGLMANFTNSYPGSQGRSVSTGILSSVKDEEISVLGGDSFINWGNLNFRIYWDGDLCSEVLDSPGTAKEASIEKPGTGRLFTSSGCNMNNSSKNNPCFQGDIIGDWREEIVVRHGAGLRVYTTGLGTGYSMPSLWFDHQYRQAMVWQMMAYNQPPHLSYFLGEMENITVAPPALTTRGRTLIANGGTVAKSVTSPVLLCETNDMTVSVADGASPEVVFVNAPTWVQGHDDNDNITATVYTHTLTGGAFTGSTRLTKQGDGVLVLPAVSETYTGNTDIWAGTLQFDGIMESSPVWLNRFTTLKSAGGTFKKGITADYGASVIPGGEGNVGSITVSTLTLNFGARLVLDVDAVSMNADQVNASALVIGTQTDTIWEKYGPQYLKPVIELRQLNGTLPEGTYDLGSIGTVTGSVSDIILEGLDGAPSSSLQFTGGHLLLVVGSGVSTVCAQAAITQTGLRKNGEGLFLPVVSIAKTGFTYKGKTVFPNLTATFTNLSGEESEADIINTLYQEDYEDKEEVTGWTAKYLPPMSIATGDATYGKYLQIDLGSTATRYAYTRPSGVDVSGCLSYNIEFDLAIKPGNTDRVEFCVMSKNGTNPTNNWDNYASINSNANMLFDITAADKNSTSFIVNGTDTATTLASGTWYHYTLEVDRTANAVKWSVSNGDSGTFTLPDGTSSEFDGFYFVAGRYNSVIKLDNIRIYQTDQYAYTFTEPGTLSVVSSYDGCKPSAATFTAKALVLGDVNGDAQVTAQDASLVLQHVAGKVDLEGADLVAADVNADGNVTAQDASLILQKVAGKADW